MRSASRAGSCDSCGEEAGGDFPSAEQWRAVYSGGEETLPGEWEDPDLGDGSAADNGVRVPPGFAVPSLANVRVAIRVRPFDKGTIISVPRKNVVSITKEPGTGGNQWLSSQRGCEQEHHFDCVFGPSATQAEVYDWSGRPLLAAGIAEARNVTILVYGATGAGKTHTMFGTGDDAGLIHRSLEEVFGIAGSIPGLVARVAFLELYNDKLEDLLQEGGGVCDIREDARNQYMQVAGLTEVQVATAEEAKAELAKGLLRRKVEATAANARSSRSHAVFQLKLERAESGQVHSKISLIDLAGSERASQTKNVGKALLDGAKINTSLLALAECIKALADDRKRDGRIPFYNSKLTRLLKYSFMGDGLVSMIANIHPGREHYEDSHNTIMYAKHAAGITVEPLRRGSGRLPPAVSMPSMKQLASDSSPLAQATPTTQPSTSAHSSRHATPSRRPVTASPADLARPRSMVLPRGRCSSVVLPTRLKLPAAVPRYSLPEGPDFGFDQALPPSASPRSPRSPPPDDRERVALWRGIIETLQSEKASLERQLLESALERERERGHLQAEIARLREVNRMKDQQILSLVRGVEE